MAINMNDPNLELDENGNPISPALPEANLENPPGTFEGQDNFGGYLHGISPTQPDRFGGAQLANKTEMERDLGVPVMSGNDFAQPESPAASLVNSLGDAKPAAEPKPIKSAISEPVLRYMAKNGDDKAKKVLEDAYGPDLNDDALKAALKSKADRESDLDWLMIANQFGNAYAAQSGGKGIDVINPYLKKQLDEAGRPVTDIETRRKGLDQATKLQDAKLDVNNKAQISSPNSEISALARDFAKNKLGLNVGDNVSYESLKGIMNDSRLLKQFEEQIAARKEANALTAENQKLAREDRKNTLDEKNDAREKDRELRFNKAALDYTEKLTNNHALKTFSKEGFALDQVSELLNQANAGNTVAFQAVGTKLARAMGEVGVLTDEDVKRYVQSGKLTQRGADILNKWKTGKASQATVQEIAEIAEALKGQFKSKVQPIYDQYANRMSRNLGIPLEEAYSRLDVPMNAQTKSEKQEQPQKAAPKREPAAAKPKTVTQNGHTYTLNEMTGQYE